MKYSRFWKLAIILLAATAVGMGLVARRNLKRDYEVRVRQWSGKNWICYAPTHYDPRRSLFATEGSIRADLELLRSTGFDGIITYESSGPLARTPVIARSLGMAVIQGVWGPVDRKELESAVKLRDSVDAYCVGNEGLGTRYSLRELDEGVAYLANRVKAPVAISEQIHMYFLHPELVDIGDWLFPIVHPHFGNAKSFEAAVRWIAANTLRLDRLAVARGHRKSMFIKEIGMPSGGDAAYSEAEQARFLWYLLRRPDLRFALFEAFDRKGWEYISPVEPYWGIFRFDRTPKAVALRLDDLLRLRTARVR